MKKMDWINDQLDSDPDNEPNFIKLHDEFHKLKGTGATYGFEDISTLSAQALPLCKELYDHPNPENRHNLDKLTKQLEQYIKML